MTQVATAEVLEKHGKPKNMTWKEFRAFRNNPGRPKQRPRVGTLRHPHNATIDGAKNYHYTALGFGSARGIHVVPFSGRRTLFRDSAGHIYYDSTLIRKDR